MLHVLTICLILVFISFLCGLLFLNLLGLPANWIILVCGFLWIWLYPGQAHPGLLFWGALLALALLGEILETGLQLHKARQHGSSKTGTFGGMLGAIVGSILFAPFFLGLGAVFGAFAGAWFGCFLLEILKGRRLHEASKAAFGTLHGRFLGTICKCGIGAAMIVIITRQIWPTNAFSAELYNECYLIAFCLLSPAHAIII